MILVIVSGIQYFSNKVRHASNFAYKIAHLGCRQRKGNEGFKYIFIPINHVSLVNLGIIGSSCPSHSFENPLLCEGEQICAFSTKC